MLPVSRSNPVGDPRRGAAICDELPSITLVCEIAGSEPPLKLALHGPAPVDARIGPLALECDEATAGNDIARVNRGGGEGGDARRPEETGPGGSQEVVEPD